MKIWPYIIAVTVIASAAQGISLTAKWDPNTNSDIVVGYSGNGTASSTRARVFSLSINAKEGTILSVRGYFPKNGGGYNIYPGSIVVDHNTGIVKSFGTPVESDNRYGMGRSVLGSGQIIVVMCSLYEGTANTPVANGNLLTITMDKRCAVTVAPETVYRGGVISEDGDTMYVEPIILCEIANYARCPQSIKALPVFTPNDTVIQTVHNDWMTLIKPTYFDAKFDNLCTSVVCLSPAQHAVAENWLSTSTIADYNGDGICGPKDWAWACRDDFLKKGVVWGRNKKTLAKNLLIYIDEAHKRQQHVVPNSKAHRDLARMKSDWTKAYVGTIWMDVIGTQKRISAK